MRAEFEHAHGRSEIRIRRFTAHGFQSRALECGPDGGRSETIVFLHGGPGSADDWRPILISAGGVGRAVAFDLPGFGEASRPRAWGYGPDSFATFLAAALAELEVEHAHLVMSDLGGLAGLHWAAAHPDQFISAVMINTGVLSGYRWHPLARLHRLPVLGRVTAVSARLGFRQAMRLHEPGLTRETLARWPASFDWGTRRGLLRFYRAAPAAVSERLIPGLAALNRPALALWGERDRFVSHVQAGRQRKAFPNAKVRILPGLGHYPHLEEDPELIATEVVSFLTEQIGAPDHEGPT